SRPSFSGIFASTPVADSDTVYVQDLRSNVFALDRVTGTLRWAHHFDARNDGPNGLAVDDGRVYGATDESAFALAAANGRELWRRHLTSATEQFVDVAPVPWHGALFTGTVGYPPDGRGAIYGLDAATGRVRWRFATIARPWRHPQLAGGGGIWNPVSVDDEGRLYAGTANPSPWGGSRAYPNGGAFPGPVPYSDSLVVLDPGSGRLLWHDQVTPHDVRDYDFEATPIVAGAQVIGAGKSGRVIAWNRTSRRRVWSTAVGKHLHDTGPLPRRLASICPGILGGVESPMAYAHGRVFVPVVNLCSRGSATTRQHVIELDPLHGTGEILALSAATGRVLWRRRLAEPDFGCATVANDVVFTSTYDGAVFALAAATGKVLWRARAPARINACTAVAGDTLLVGAGVGRRAQLVAFSLPRAR